MSFVRKVARLVGKALSSADKAIEVMNEPFDNLERKCFKGRLADDIMDEKAKECYNEAVTGWKEGQEEAKKEKANETKSGKGDPKEERSGRDECESGGCNDGWVEIR